MDELVADGSPRLLDILLVDDNQADIRLFQLATARAPVRITVLRDGEAAIQWLRRSEAEATVDLIVLDLHMPLADGFQVLEHLKHDARWRSIPVVVMSTSSLERDVLRAYRLGAASYVVKPASLDAYLRVIGFLVEYWGQHVTLPKMAGC